MTGELPELADLEFLPGDVVTQRDGPPLRYRVRASSPGWVSLARVRKDGGIDRREYGFSGGTAGWVLAERPEGLTFSRSGRVWMVAEAICQTASNDGRGG